MKRWPIRTLRPMRTPGWIRASAPIRVPAPTDTCAPIRAPGPIRTASPMTAKGPIDAPAPISASAAITTVGWMPPAMPGPASKARVIAAMASRGRPTKIAVSSPSARQSAPCQSTAARARPLASPPAYFASMASARSSGPASAGSATPVTRSVTSPSAAAPSARAISSTEWLPSLRIFRLRAGPRAGHTATDLALNRVQGHPGGPHRLENPRIAAVDVAAIVDLAARIRPGGEIDQMHRHGTVKHDRVLRPRMQVLLEEPPRVVGLPRQERVGEVEGLAEPDAAVAVGAHLLLEERLRRRVVKVDVPLVREHELHEAERVAVRGRLRHREGEIVRRELGEVHRIAVHHPAAAIDDLQVTRRARVLLQHRQVFL